METLDWVMLTIGLILIGALTNISSQIGQLITLVNFMDTNTLENKIGQSLDETNVSLSEIDGHLSDINNQITDVIDKMEN